MISLDNLKTTINAIKYLLTNYPKKKDIPIKLPNSNPFNFLLELSPATMTAQKL